MAAITFKTIKSDIIDKLNKATIAQEILYKTKVVFPNDKKILVKANQTIDILEKAIIVLENILVDYFDPVSTVKLEKTFIKSTYKIMKEVSKMSTEELQQSIQEIISEYNNERSIENEYKRIKTVFKK
jgi:hypothetical protein